MSSMVQSSLDWLRRTLRWSNSRQAWQERAGAAAVLALAVFTAVYGYRFRPLVQVALWALVLAALAVLLRRGWLKLFGPVLFYDLVRTARRTRYFLIRGVYGFVLLTLLGWIWLVWYMESGYRNRGLDASDMTEFASSFFYTFMGVQFLVVAVLTPAYTAGAITDEKERRTLEFLLATDLHNREIVLSKLVSRLANLLLLVLVGLPILGFLQFLGGVDPGLVVAGFIATGLTVLSLAGLSIFFSVLVRKSRDAIVLTYLTGFAYLVVASSSVLLHGPPGWADFPTQCFKSPLALADVVERLNAGNIIIAIAKLEQGDATVAGMVRGGARSPLGDVLPDVLRDYVIFHGAAALLCSVWAVLRLRAVFLKETYGKPQKGSLAARLWLRPAVGNHPMVWKEVFAESRMHWHWLGRIFVFLLVICSFVPVGFIVAEFIDDQFYSPSRSYYYPRTAWEELGRSMNIWARTVGTLVACLMLLGVAVRAASSIGVERDRQTFDSLLTSPLDSTSILFGKWLGSVLSVRWGWLWLGATAALALVATGLHPLALPLLFVAWFIYAAFLATIGLYFSMVSRTTLRATVWTLTTVVGVALGHWLIWLCCIPLFIMGRGSDADLWEMQRWVLQFQTFGLTPPATLGFLAFHGNDFEHVRSGRNEAMEFLACAIVGLGIYAAATAFLWGGVSARFRQITGRTPFRRPESPGHARTGHVRAPSPEPLPPALLRKPLRIAEEAPDGHIRPEADGRPPRPRGAFLIEEEWRDDEQRPRQV